MKNSMLILIIVMAGLTSCKKEDLLDGECHFITDSLPPWYFKVEFMDANGNNLLANGFYDRDKITAKLNDNDFGTLGLKEHDDHLRFSALGKEGDNRLLLTLSETDVDTLDFSWTSQQKKFLTNERDLQCITEYYLGSLSYNGIGIDFGGPTPGTPMDIPIKIVKPTD